MPEKLTSIVIKKIRYTKNNDLLIIEWLSFCFFQILHAHKYERVALFIDINISTKGGLI